MRLVVLSIENALTDPVEGTNIFSIRWSFQEFLQKNGWNLYVPVRVSRLSLSTDQRRFSHTGLQLKLNRDLLLTEAN